MLERWDLNSIDHSMDQSVVVLESVGEVGLEQY